MTVREDMDKHNKRCQVRHGARIEQCICGWLPTLDSALAAIERVEELHISDQLPVGIIICHHCRTPWPCNTIEALDDEDQ